MRIYQIQEGDTLSGLSDKFHVPLSGLHFANPDLVNIGNNIVGIWIVVPYLYREIMILSEKESIAYLDNKRADYNKEKTKIRKEKIKKFLDRFVSCR